MAIVKRLALATLAALLSAAAGCHHKPSPSDYDRSCESVTDCAAVYIGPLGCCDQPCPNAAVRTTAAERARNDVEAARECAGPTPPCLPQTPGQCPDSRVLCEQGTCTLEMNSDPSTPPACALTNGSCTPLTPHTSCTPRLGFPYDRANGCVSSAPETLACCATSGGGACLQEDALNCVMPTSGEAMMWRTAGTWSATGFGFCDDATRDLVTSAPTCGR